MAAVLGAEALTVLRTLVDASTLAEVRAATPGDMGRLLAVLDHVPEFRDADVQCARSVLEDAFTGASTYRVLLDERGGFAIFGRTPMTDATFDLYWLAVDQRARCVGVGADLLGAALRAIRAERGRRVRVETEDAHDSGPARRLYERAGLTVIARFPDFYGAGRALLTYYGEL